MAITKLGQIIKTSTNSDNSIPMIAGAAGGGIGGYGMAADSVAKSMAGYDDILRQVDNYFRHANPNAHLGLDKLNRANKIMRNRAIGRGAIGGAVGGVGAFGLVKLIQALRNKE